MINLINRQVNDDIIIYVNTMDPDIPYDSNNFLFGFKNGFTHEWTYVMPQIVKQNTRYTQFGIVLVTTDEEDQESGFVHMNPSGNWDYRLWAIDEPTLDPSFGYLLDEGQAYLEGCSESPEIVYLSDNETDLSIVYLTRDCSICPTWDDDPDEWNLDDDYWNCELVDCPVWSTDPDLWQFAAENWNCQVTD